MSFVVFYLGKGRKGMMGMGLWAGGGQGYIIIYMLYCIEKALAGNIGL